MFQLNPTLILAGLLLGFSSSLHCFAMCSGIAASLHLAAATRPGVPRGALPTALIINSGRITGYMVAGAVVGAAGAGVLSVLDRSIMNAVLRWASAFALGAIGLSMIGLLPVPVALSRAGLMISDRITVVSSAARLPPTAGLFLSGTVWGFCPCAMVYGTLFYATLAGSGFGGALVMLAFGLGTLPALLASGLGLATLRRRATSVRWQPAIGIALLALSLASVAIPPATFAEWCHFG
jgi:sulfite exporter TauE/SafE